MVLSGKKGRAQAIATIQRAERRSKCFKKFHIITKPPRTMGGIAHAIHTNSTGTQIRIQQKNELNDILRQRNQEHFAQAHGTPFTVPPLSRELLFSGVSSQGRAILNGKYNNPECPTSAKLIIAELAQIRPELPHTMPFHAMITGLSKWRESTTTSPSGKHLGIYKALIQYHRHTSRKSKKDEEQGTNYKSAYLALKIQHLIINMAIHHTHTLERWKTVHNFFIEKIPGKPLLVKLRVIHIYEADWNLILKYFIACR
jgi:hypothetical protein